MIQYATLSELRTWSLRLNEERSTLAKAARDRSPAGSTFLSHSSKDADYIDGVVLILSNHGATVYLDKKDETLPPYTNRDTANKLRSRINQCKKFVMFATNNSKDSKWVPWELGVSDGYKRSINTAIFPGADTAYETTWAEREYLGVYDRIVYGDLEGESEKVWMVLNQEKNTATQLTKWLAA